MNQSQATITQRKSSHIELAQDEQAQMQHSPFDAYDLPYTALPEINLADVDCHVELLGKKLSQPLIIASMTGGSQHAEKINKNLAVAAQECGVALAVGSQRIMLKDQSARKSFETARKNAPDAFLFANIGAAQLVDDVSPDDVRSLIDAIQAQALYIHLNPLQEALQPEGDTNFKGVLVKIHELVTALQKDGVPVFVKEVGHGLSARDARMLLQTGVIGIDVAGTGGTSWAWIEAQRGEHSKAGEWFKDFGHPTDACLIGIDALRDEAGCPEFILVASGGVRSPLDGLKSLQLGAQLYSFAHPILEPALAGPDECIQLLKEWESGLRIGMFGCGIEKLV